ncbi:MAG: hypothetical protein KC656_15485, partial [Myxococcales bacterium]|nr:hypothetical protein [Myxococcales bacterium]
AVRILVQAGHHREAAEAIAGPVSARMIGEGSSTSVALMWTTLPEGHRNPLRLAQIVEAMAGHPKGDRGAALLFRTLADDDVPAFCATWVAHRGKAALAPTDAVMQAAVAGAGFPVWLRAVADARGVRAIREALVGVLDDPADSRWATAHHVIATGMPPEEALRLASQLPADEALEPIARELLLPALSTLRFPDAQLAQTAARYATLDETLLWGWVGVAAAGPGAHPDEVIDGTVVAVCETPPAASDRRTCRAAARQLGAAGGWTPLDHARWIVRLTLAPQQSGMAEELLEALLEGLVGRFDAAPHVASLVAELFQLGPEHPALVGLMKRWLPRAWRSRMPSAFVEAVKVRGVPPDVKLLWDALIHADR